VRNMTFSPHYLVAANLLLLALIAYSASSIVGHVLAGRMMPGVRVDIAPPPEPIAEERVKPGDYYRVISQRDIFNSAKVEVPADIPVPAAPPKDLQLWGVALHEDEAQRYCIIEDKKERKQVLYRINGTIEGTNTTVKAIEWNNVVLARGEEELILALQEPGTEGKPSRKAASRRQGRRNRSRPSDKGIQEVSEGEYLIERAEVDKAFENMSQLFTQIRAVPHFEGGQSTGFRLFSIRRGSLFDKIGLRNGDVLQKINDIEFNDPSRAMSAMQELRDADNLTVKIVRNRREQTLSYRVQ